MCAMMFDPNSFDPNSFGLPSEGKKLFQIFAVDQQTGVGATGKAWSAVKVHAVIVKDAVPESGDEGKSSNAMLFVGDKAVELFKLLVATKLQKIIDLEDFGALKAHLIGKVFVAQIKHREVPKDDGTTATYAGIDGDRGCTFDPYGGEPLPAWAALVDKAKEDHDEWIASRKEASEAKSEKAEPESAGTLETVPF